MKGVHILAKENVDYLNEMLLNPDGSLRIISYEELKDVPQNHISAFCVNNGVYCLPTTELIDFLRSEISGQEQKTIEIGAGNGVICKELGIVGTDSLMQLRPDIKAMYANIQQPTVKYGDHVKGSDAKAALSRYKPDIVIAAWVTHKYNPNEHWREGNQYGVVEEDVLKKVKKYIFIGNAEVHRNKPILELPHRTIKEPWLLARSQNTDNEIYIWGS